VIVDTALEQALRTLIPDAMSGNEFVGSSGGFAEGMVDLAGDIAFDAAHDFVFVFAFGEAAGDVVTGAGGGACARPG
jgi:hypothetical protein